MSLASVSELVLDILTLYLFICFVFFEASSQGKELVCDKEREWVSCLQIGYDFDLVLAVILAFSVCYTCLLKKMSTFFPRVTS